MPTGKYGPNNTVKLGAFEEYFHKKSDELKGNLTNKSTQRTKRGLELKSYNQQDQIVKIRRRNSQEPVKNFGLKYDHPGNKNRKKIIKNKPKNGSIRPKTSKHRSSWDNFLNDLQPETSVSKYKFHKFYGVPLQNLRGKF
mmetsp:Transcript_9390/g.8293  ORF Transcript_9390/g.8293 Transcript_9390/m.8293 type:complete len:140 (-) Transcript_9390:21-440(-)